MGHQALVYGVIEVFTSSSSRREADARNDAALQALPAKDDWPFLIRSMFSATASEEVSVAYMYRVIHFGASMKEVEQEWSEWLVKFEQLLARLDGISATVHLQAERAGSHTCVWLRTSDSLNDWPPVWKFESGPRSF